MTLCERCVHQKICEIRSVQDEDDERALVECSNFFEVVRCKDCEYYCEDCVCKVHSEYEDKYTRVYTVYKDVDDFCSYGERKGAT